MNGTHRMPSTTITTVEEPSDGDQLPLAGPRLQLLVEVQRDQRGRRVEVAPCDDISAAISAATMIPIRPGGSSRTTSVG